MSQYQQIREALREDIHELVEKELFSRMTNIIPALMPAILEFVAQSIKVYTSDLGGFQQQIHVNLEFTDPLTHQTHHRTLHTQKTLNPDKISGELFHITEFYNHLNQRLQILEHESTRQDATP